MSLERNEQEEGPGAFLSLSGGQGSSSPFRGPPLADSSPHVKQEQGRTYLSLQQPSQESPHQLVHAQESWRSPIVDPAVAPHVEKSLYEQSGAPQLTRPEDSGDKKEPGASENDRTSTPESREPSSSEAHSEQQNPTFTGHESPVSLKSSPEQRPATTWLSFVEQQKNRSSLVISQQKNRKEATSLTCLNPLSLHGIPDQKQSASPLSLQVPPKQEKHGEEKVTLLLEDEKASLLQPSTEHNPSFLHSTCDISPQLEHARDVPIHIQEQKVSKGLTDQFNLTSSQASSEQQRLPLLQQWHKSAFIQAHLQQGPKDGCSQGPLAEQKLEFLHGLSAQQTNFGSPRYQPVSPCDPLRTQQGFVAQSTTPITQDRMGVFSVKPNVSPNQHDQSGFLREELKLSMKSASSQGAEQNYPPPMTTHDAVLADKRLFMETLQCFHAGLSLHLSLPKVEGFDLDVHKLYKEVTSWGGLELVTIGKKWQAIAWALGCPLNSTNVFSILERIYISTLYYYEQVYFMGASGKIVPAPVAALSSQSFAHSDPKEVVFNEMESRPTVTNGSVESAQALNVDPTSSIGTTVSGAIDGKFEDGYLVTVMVGARKLRGVLYHVSSTDIPSQNVSMPSMMQSVDAEIHFPDGASKVGLKRKKREVFRKDPNAPRQNRTGYNFFFAEQRAKLKTMQPDKDRAISKMIGELWSKLSENEKIPYQLKGVKDKERYVKEMKEYKEKKLPMISPNESQSVNPPLHSQLTCAQILQSPHQDPKVRASMLAFSYAPEGLSSFRCVPPQPPIALLAQPANTLSGAHTQLPLSESSKVLETGMLHLGSPTARSVDERGITRDAINCSSVPASEPPMVIATNAVSGASTVNYPLSDPSASSAVDMSKFLIDEMSPKSLPQSECQDQAGGVHLSKKEEHVSAMEH